MKKTDTNKFDAVEEMLHKEGIRIQENTLAEIIAILNLAEDRIAAVLAATPTDWQAWYLPQLKQSIRQALSELATQAPELVANASTAAWQNGINQVDKPLQAINIVIKGLAPEIDTRSLQAMRSFMTDRIENISVELINKINSRLGLVAIGAESPADAITYIASVLDKGGRSRANTIVRTELGRITEVAKFARQQAAIKSGVKMQKQWRRSGKIHSRISHDAADGQIVDIDKPFNIAGVKMTHPRDPAAPASETINCGCWNKTVVEGFKPQFPGAKPFSELELRQSERKRLINDQSRLNDLLQR